MRAGAAPRAAGRRQPPAHRVRRGTGYWPRRPRPLPCRCRRDPATHRRRFDRGSSAPQRRRRGRRRAPRVSCPARGQQPQSPVATAATDGHEAASSRRGRAPPPPHNPGGGPPPRPPPGRPPPPPPPPPPRCHHPPRAVDRPRAGSSVNGGREPTTRRRRRPRRRSPPTAAALAPTRSARGWWRPPRWRRLPPLLPPAEAKPCPTRSRRRARCRRPEVAAQARGASRDAAVEPPRLPADHVAGRPACQRRRSATSKWRGASGWPPRRPAAPPRRTR